ncbi:uncharacterized protein EKO05_0004069 [Ascochyta rabiei]|uniref:uncharacterized protein n=1 Tax=Didymella rabiei TaxID=5454 RepID=UPI0022025ACF|nr:uncharacterized protein EKO05_0004069 [Ascochyta rabiei]UPX13566.1 hypothetical protein EKO05_0004069 [Ascochyta rabiei]
MLTGIERRATRGAKGDPWDPPQENIVDVDITQFTHLPPSPRRSGDTAGKYVWAKRISGFAQEWFLCISADEWMEGVLRCKG